MSAASPSSSGIMRSLFGPMMCLLESRQVVYYLTRKRILLRYRGSALGIVWSFVVPALTLAIYTVVFGMILRARWSNDDSSTTEYALLLYLGLCVYWFISDCISEAPGLIANHSSYVKKVVFPLEILPWVSVSDALFHSVIRLGIFVIAFAVLQGLPPWTLILLPVVWLPVCLWTLGFCWMLAAAGVFLRDLREIINLMLVAMLFLSPIFYSIDRLPTLVHSLVLLNPVAIPVMQTREVAYYGVIPDPAVWLTLMLASAAFAWLGYALFSRSRGAFADVV